MDWFIGLTLLLVIICFLNILYFTIRNGIGPVPTSIKVKNTLLSHLPNTIDGPILELGSAWGSLAFALAQKYPEQKVIGFENSLVPYLFSKLRLFIFPQKKLKFKRRDFFKENLHNSSLIICYLYPGAMALLELKFKKELKEGTLVVSHTFALPKTEPKRIITCPDLYQTKIYFYFCKQLKVSYLNES